MNSILNMPVDAMKAMNKILTQIYDFVFSVDDGSITSEEKQAILTQTNNLINDFNQLETIKNYKKVGTDFVDSNGETHSESEILSRQIDCTHDIAESLIKVQSSNTGLYRQLQDAVSKLDPTNQKMIKYTIENSMNFTNKNSFYRKLVTKVDLRHADKRYSENTQYVMPKAQSAPKIIPATVV